MAYYNRQAQLALTLKSIEKSLLKDNIEVIIVDDCSDEDQKAKPIVIKSDLDIKLIEICKEEKTWRNPGVTYNIGFKEAVGNIIIIQNAECLHIGDLIYHTSRNVTDQNYLSYSCFCVDYEINKQIENNWDNNYKKVISILNKLKQEHPHLSDWKGWYNHIIYRPTGYHWLSAITAKNLKKLGGFDKRYANGYAYDDNDFFLRIKIMGLYIEIVSEKIGYAVHQKHERIQGLTTTRRHLCELNYKLFCKLKKEYENKYGKEISAAYKKSNAILLG